MVNGATVAGAGLASGAAVRAEVPLAVTGEDVTLVVHAPARLSRRAREGVETLAAQVALALESANLAADLHERQSAERFRSLVQNSSDLIALLSPDLTIRYHTPSVERVLGYAGDELVGRKLTELLQHEDAEKLPGFCRQVASWRQLGHLRLGVSVNLSARELVSSLPGEISTALGECALDPSALTLEITENTLLDSQAVVGRLDELRTLGVRIAIDDFGTDYSSLNYLRRFPVDTSKIAKAFVDELGTSPEQNRLVAAILRLVATMGLETVA